MREATIEDAVRIKELMDATKPYPTRLAALESRITQAGPIKWFVFEEAGKIYVAMKISFKNGVLQPAPPYIDKNTGLTFSEICRKIYADCLEYSKQNGITHWKVSCYKGVNDKYFDEAAKFFSEEEHNVSTKDKDLTKIWEWKGQKSKE